MPKGGFSDRAFRNLLANSQLLRKPKGTNRFFLLFAFVWFYLFVAVLASVRHNMDTEWINNV